RLVKRVRIGCGGTDRGESAAPADRAETGDRLTAGNAERRVRVPDSGPVQGVVHDVDSVVADEELVHERRAEHAVPVEREVTERRIAFETEEQRKRSLVVFLVVFRHRDAPEHLVLRRRVPVDADVALVGTDGGQRVADEVPADAAAYGAVGQRVE